MAERWNIIYRPRKFSTVLGQVPVVNFCAVVLKRYYEDEQEMPVGFLFGGRSGVGKTTLARIVGASLNCAKRNGIEPCGKCSSCDAIFKGHGGVREIDAAFFGLVDNIRALREELSSYSVHHYEVVILDEAHMMSREAFNVLLKLLEEPPARTLFILCTTEAHKVLETVRSRLSEFRFTSIKHEIVNKYLSALLKKEKVECDSAIYSRLYRLSNDNLRDVIVSLEQLSRLGEGKITKELTADTFGDIFIYEKVLTALKERDYGKAVSLYQEYSVFYTDFAHFLNGFLLIAGDYFATALRTGSSEALFYGSLFTAIYRFHQTVVYLKGEAAAKLFFHVLSTEVSGGLATAHELLAKGSMTEEEALDFLRVDK